MKRLAGLAEALPVLAFAAAVGLFLVAPLGVLALQAVTAPDGGFTLAPFVRYLAEPGLARSLGHTVVVGGGVTAIVLPLAFLVAFALERSRLPFRGLLQGAASIPLLIPSLLPALALVYLFGHQGLLTPLLGGRTIYGLPGVLIADAVAAFPHALIILRTALAAADGRLYEQAELLGSPPWRTFWRITLPCARHGLVSAGVVASSLSIADVGAPKVVGGDFDVLALDIYKAVLGRQDFQAAAVAALFLLAPSLVAVVVERVPPLRQVPHPIDVRGRGRVRQGVCTRLWRPHELLEQRRLADAVRTGDRDALGALHDHRPAADGDRRDAPRRRDVRVGQRDVQ